MRHEIRQHWNAANAPYWMGVAPLKHTAQIIDFFDAKRRLRLENEKALAAEIFGVRECPIKEALQYLEWLLITKGRPTTCREKELLNMAHDYLARQSS